LPPALTDKLAALPEHPGVYIFRDSAGRIIYIGKAKSLRARVRTYFTVGDDGRYQYPRLIASIRDVEVILVRDEVEALKTEANLIRLHRPRFNVDLRDDKSFPYLKITHEPYPRVVLTRKPAEGTKGDIYGPFTDVQTTRYLLRTLKGILQVRDCNLPLTPEKVAAGKFRLCLDYHIGRCGAPCEAKVSQEQYAQGVSRFVQFLKGRHEEIITALEDEMKQFATDLRFEDAAHARDRLSAARRFSDKQQKVDPDPIDCDAVGLAREDASAAFLVMKIRGGRIIGKSPFHMERAVAMDDGALLEAFLLRHYEVSGEIPDALYLPVALPDPLPFAEFLSGLAKHKVQIHVPQRGEKRKLVEIAITNADHLLAERRLMAEKRDFIPRAVKALQENLRMAEPPLIIEAFDISHLSGTDTVASMVCFKEGKPYKAGYRIFKIRTVEGIDDFASMGEAVERRYTRLIREIGESPEADVVPVPEETEIDEAELESEQDSGVRLPDLILIDGGLGQLGRAKETLVKLGLKDLPVIGLAKRLEEVYVPGTSEPLLLPRSSSALRLLQQVRDEAHRFAVTRQRMLRGKRQVKSRLDDIPGVGPTRRQALLKKFSSVKRISEANVADIAATPGLNLKLAETIKSSLTGSAS